MSKAETARQSWIRLILRPVIATGAVAAAFVVKQILLQRFGITLPAFATLYPSVMLVALFLGMWNGIWATSLATVLAAIWIFDLLAEPGIATLSDSVALALFFAMGILLSAVVERYRRTQRRAAALEREQALRNTWLGGGAASAYRSLALEAANLGAWDHDLETGRVTWDERCRNGFGIATGKSVDYQTVLARIPEVDRSVVDGAVKAAIAGANGGTYHQEFRVVWPDGTVHWVASHGRVYFEGEGDQRRPVHFLGVDIDITQHRRTEKVLETTLQRFYTILSNLNSGVLLVTNDNRVEFANRAFCGLFGLEESPSALVELNAGEMISKIHDAYRDAAAISRIGEILGRGEPVFNEEIPMRNGGTFIRDFVPLIVDGESYGRLWVHTEITERKRMETRLRRFYESDLFAILYWKIDGGVVDVNDRFLAMTGYTREDVRAGVLNWTAMTPPEYRVLDEEARRQVRETGVHLSYEKEFIRKDGKRVWGQFWGAAYEDDRTEGVSFILNITERRRAEHALRQSKLEWERTFNSLPDLIAIIDNQHRIVRVNKAMGQKLGKEPEDCVGLSCFASVHGLMAPIANCPHALTLLDGREHAAEIQEDRLGGDFLVSTTPLLDEHGGAAGVVHVARNISERKRAEAELGRLNRTLRAISNSNQALLHATDEPAFLEEVCRIIKEDCGHAMVWIGSAEDDENKTVRPVAHAGLEESYLETLRVTWEDNDLGRGPTGTAIRTGKPCMCRNMLEDPTFLPWRKQATTRGYASSLVIPLLERDKALGAITIYSKETDSFSEPEVELLTELAGDVEFGIQTLRARAAHSRAEEALRESELRFRSVLDDSRDVIYRLNVQTGRYEYISPSAKTVMGFSREELAEMEVEWVLMRVHPDDLAAVQASMARLMTTGREEMEYRMRVKDGRYLWLSSYASLVRDNSGRPLYRDGTIRDITAKKQAEDALLRSEKLASVGRMAATISHEINNPLAAVTNLLFLAQWNQDLPDAVRRNLELADEELKRIAHITQQSLGFYRESNAPAIVRVDGVLESAIDLMKSKIKSRGAVIETESVGNLEVNAVAGELRQVFANLLANSLDAIEDGGMVRLCVSNGPDFEDGHRSVQVVVTDNGKGISESSQEHIFEPFFTTKGTVGTGLGLWVTKEIIEKHQGTIGVRSNTDGPHRGTVFTVVLPAMPARAIGPKPDAVLANTL